MKREALVPISEERAAEILAMRERVVAEMPGYRLLLGRHKTRTSSTVVAITSQLLNSAINDWLAECDIRDEYGSAAHLTPISSGTPSARG